MLKTIIIGATSGIGLGLARALPKQKYTLGLTGLCEEDLKKLKTELKAVYQVMDVTKPEPARNQLHSLIDRLGGLDLLIVNAGISVANSNWEQDQAMIATNVLGFTAIAQAGLTYFINQRSGHLVGLSSIAAIRGRANNITYSATKAYISNYLQGWRQKLAREKLPIAVTEIIPGYVDTPMIKGRQNLFWVAPLDKAVSQMLPAIKQKKCNVYITKRWFWLAWFLKLIPDWIHQKL